MNEQPINKSNQTVPVYPEQSHFSSRTHGTGRDLVLLHGWGLNSGVWDGVVNDLAQTFRVTCIDLPGFGFNANYSPEDYSLNNVTDMVVDLVPHNAIVLGWSLGGLVAQNMALKHAHKLAGLIGVATTPCFKQRADWAGIQPKVLVQFERQLERDFHKTLSRFLAIQALGSPDAKGEIKLLQQAIENYPFPAVTALRHGLRLLSEVDLRDKLQAIAVPTLHIHGRCDSLVPQASVAQLQSLQPGAQREIIAHAAHAPFISHAQIWLNIVRQFIQSI